MGDGKNWRVGFILIKTGAATLANDAGPGDTGSHYTLINVGEGLRGDT